VNLFRDNPVLRGAVFLLSAVALMAFFVHLRHSKASRAAAESDRASVAVSPPPAAKSAAPPHFNSNEILARCQPELKEIPSVPTFEVDDNRYNRVAVQLKARFVVDYNGFVLNAYVAGSTVVSPQDQEAALEYIRHLTFEAPTAEECQPIKMQMVGNFHMAKDSTGDWITVFDVHPVYSFNGTQIVVTN